jgi:hypothetical protein
VLHVSFKEYWMRALGEITAEDRLVLGDGGNWTVEERKLGTFAYESAFGQVKSQLETAALAPVDPGWDLTAFGYVAKTCRDHEYLSTGPIPASCIVATTQVERTKPDA